MSRIRTSTSWGVTCLPMAPQVTPEQVDKAINFVIEKLAKYDKNELEVRDTAVVIFRGCCVGCCFPKDMISKGNPLPLLL